MRTLVTGHSGFIGSHLTDRLVNLGHDVFGLSRNKKNNESNGGVSGMECDLLDKEKSADLIGLIRPEIVFHCAANAAEGKSQFSPREITESNINIFMNTIVPSINIGVRRFVFISSVAVYGGIQVPFRESDPPSPQDIYGINKLAAEQSLKVLAKVHNFEYVIVRPHNVYGPRQRMDDPYRNVVTIFMNNILGGKQYSIYGDGSMTRCFSYINDVADVIVRTGFDRVDGMTVNVGTNENTSINKLSDMIRTIARTDIEPLYIKDRPQEVHIAQSDHTLCEKLFGYEDTPLGHGLQETWEWAKEKGYQEPKLTEVEIQSESLPKIWK